MATVTKEQKAVQELRCIITNEWRRTWWGKIHDCQLKIHQQRLVSRKCSERRGWRHEQQDTWELWDEQCRRHRIGMLDSKEQEKGAEKCFKQWLRISQNQWKTLDHKSNKLRKHTHTQKQDKCKKKKPKTHPISYSNYRNPKPKKPESKINAWLLLTRTTDNTFCLLISVSWGSRHLGSEFMNCTLISHSLPAASFPSISLHHSSSLSISSFHAPCLSNKLKKKNLKNWELFTKESKREAWNI